MSIAIFFFLILFCPTANSYSDGSINLLTRSSINSTVRRYCVELAKLPNGDTINIKSFGWHTPYFGSASVNACNVTDLKISLPPRFPIKTIIVLYEHQCKITEHAWNVEKQYGNKISLMIVTNRTDSYYELTYNTTFMPVSIPVLVFVENDFKKMSKTYSNISQVEISIDFPLLMPKKFRPAVLLMFLLVFFVFICGNLWAADEFSVKIKQNRRNVQNEPTNSNLPSTLNDSADETPNTETQGKIVKKPQKHQEPAIIYMPYCIIGVLLCFAVTWLLLIYYFPKVMVYVLQVMYCIGAFSSLFTCINRLSYFVPKLRSFSLPSYAFNKPCKWKLGSINLFGLFAMVASLVTVIIWYIYRKATWGWILQDLLGIALCITVVSTYRLGNMKVITLLLLGFFLYDIFFVFITPYIPFFQPSNPSSTKTTTSKPLIDSSKTKTVVVYGKSSRTPSVMEQVALGFGTGGEAVPLLFVLPMFIPESELDPCATVGKSMLGFGDIILPGILLTFCKIFDIASGNRCPIYYIQSLVAYFIGLSMTHVALYLMNTAQPALLYLVPCLLISTILTGLCRGELKELYNGRRIQTLLDDKPKTCESTLLAGSDHSIDVEANRLANAQKSRTDRNISDDDDH